MSVQICVSVPPKTIDEAIKLIQQAETQHADIIEVRLDSLKNHDKLVKIPKYSKTPLIATNKSTKNQGHFSGTENQRQKILLDAARNGFEYIDVDLGTPNQSELISDLRKLGTKIIVSFHDFEKTPVITELDKIFWQQLDLGADVCKIITTARTLDDNNVIFNFVSEASKKAKIVCFAMGGQGKISRLISPLVGSFFTFASLDEKRKTAKGQLTIQEMKRAYDALGLK